MSPAIGTICPLAEPSSPKLDRRKASQKATLPGTSEPDRHHGRDPCGGEAGAPRDGPRRRPPINASWPVVRRARCRSFCAPPRLAWSHPSTCWVF